LPKLNAERRTCRHLCFFSFREKYRRNARSGSGHATQHCTLSSTCDPTKHCADRSAAADEDGAFLALAGNLALIIYPTPCLGVVGGEASHKASSETVRENDLVKVEPDRAGLAHSLGRRDFGDAPFDD
jgi:hypothetical protein